MHLVTRKTKKMAGLAPGTMIHLGERKVDKIRIRLISYDENRIEEKEFTSIEQCFDCKDRPGVCWINIDGLHDVDLISKIGKEFHLHPLVLEDLVNTEQRPKMEDFGDYLFVVVKMLYYDEDQHNITAEQLSLILGKNVIISFQESVGDVFEPVRERLRKGKGRIRKMGPDYLFYALIDAVVDHYFHVLEKIGERIEALEEDLISDPAPDTLQSIHDFKRELIHLKKQVWPLRELISGLERNESELIDEKTTLFLRDVYDHTIQIIDAVETSRDLVSGMMDLFLSSISNRMNEVMKVLTVIATIFIPLTFIAGIYGMNFENMPELKWSQGYPVALFVMLVIGVLMVVWFKRKKFL